MVACRAGLKAAAWGWLEGEGPVLWESPDKPGEVGHGVNTPFSWKWDPSPGPLV